MRTAIQKGAQSAVPITDEDQILIEDLANQIVVRTRDLRNVAEIDPRFQQDFLTFQKKYSRIGENPPIHLEAAARCVDLQVRRCPGFSAKHPHFSIV
jgi:hypothetical protein